MSLSAPLACVRNPFPSSHRPPDHNVTHNRHHTNRAVPAHHPNPSPISTLLARKETWGYESPEGDAYERICSVVCLYDFASSDPDHLAFRKSDVLEVVKQETSGWWAAVKGDGSEVGWIPASYVQIITDEAAERVHALREHTQIPPRYDTHDRSASTGTGTFSTASRTTRLLSTISTSSTDTSSYDTAITERDPRNVRHTHTHTLRPLY
jgi:hypothetical protein